MQTLPLEALLGDLEQGVPLEEAVQQRCDFPARFSPQVFWRQLNQWVDEKLQSVLAEAFQQQHDARIRDKIAFAILARLRIMAVYPKTFAEMERRSRCPSYQLANLKSLWHTADVIWYWAGDVATDFNHYTKRGLLVSVLVRTYIFWNRHYSGGAKDEKAVVLVIENALDKVLRIGHVARSFWPFKKKS